MPTASIRSSGENPSVVDVGRVGGAHRSPDATGTATSTRLMSRTDLRRVLATVAAALAGAGGLIHFAVVGDHLDLVVVAIGFAGMAIAQWTLALWMLARPGRRAIMLAGVLHAAIVAVWVVSRTIGLGLIPGEAGVAPVGVADLVANMFALVVGGLAVIWIAQDRAAPVVLSRSVAHRMVGVAVAGALALSVLAMWAPHDHGAPIADVPAFPTGQEHHDGPSGLLGGRGGAPPLNHGH